MENFGMEKEKKNMLEKLYMMENMKMEKEKEK